MRDKCKVLVAGASSAETDRLREMLAGRTDLQVETRLLGSNGNADALAGGGFKPDLLVLALGPAWEAELEALGTHASGTRPPLVVIAPHDDVRLMRRAMQAGARDYLPQPVAPEELVRCVETIARETTAARPGDSSITAVINSKGGSGASFVAGSLAHALASHWNKRVLLLDMDLQFGAQNLSMDLTPTGNVMEAIQTADQLDGAALEGFTARHESGVHLLGAYTDSLPLPWEVSTAKLEKLLRLAAGTYDHVIVDLPRQIDPLTTTVLDRADHICVVMNQTLTHVRDTRRILAILGRDLGVLPEQIRVVVNRHQHDAAVPLRDIEETLGLESPILIPNDYRRASEAINLGVSIHETSPNSPLARAILELGAGIAGAPLKRRSRLRSALAGLFGETTESRQ